MAPPTFRGEPLSSPPWAHAETPRSLPPAETLRRIQPHLSAAGITRLANITGLDRVGIPVTLSIRPAGKVLSVSSGKGLTLEAALVSGAMEALEMWHAEELDLPALRASLEQLSRQSAHLRPDELPRRARAPTPPTWPYTWVEGWDITSQHPVYVPRAAVSLAPGHAGLGELFTFHTTSNGLASGNDLAEAVLSGLLEVIERDAVALHGLAWGRGRPPSVVDTGRDVDPTVAALSARMREAGLRPVLLDLTTELGVPVYGAWLIDEWTPQHGVFKGYGCHLDPRWAMCRALTEAAQSRLVAIAGSRDDLFRHQASELRSAANTRAALRWLQQLPPAGAPLRASLSAPSVAEDLEATLEMLAAAGLGRVVVVDLSREGLPVRVVKVLVPGLESLEATHETLGPRARRWLTEVS